LLAAMQLKKVVFIRLRREHPSKVHKYRKATAKFGRTLANIGRTFFNNCQKCIKNGISIDNLIDFFGISNDNGWHK
jgi:hypothetical protein